MATEAEPIVGNWYEHLDRGEEFQVIDIDEESGVIEIQYLDGDLDTIEFDEWFELDLEAVEAPEDWTGPVDDVEQDDLGYSETDVEPDEWSRSTREVVRRRGGEGESEEGQEEIEEKPPQEEPWEGEA
jgi:hypothetical protein